MAEAVCLSCSSQPFLVFTLCNRRLHLPRLLGLMPIVNVGFLESVISADQRVYEAIWTLQESNCVPSG